MVDTHAHLPQLPNAGLGFALDLLTWLERVTFPTERSWSDPSVAERLAPAIFEAFAAAGTTTVLGYGTVYAAAMDAAFAAAERHGIRAILAATIDSWAGAAQTDRGLGAIDRDGWTSSITFMAGLGLVKNAVKTDDLVREDLLPAGG
jgi:cytosine/adenosine deaminase-related metal-dependent hydrolase